MLRIYNCIVTEHDLRLVFLAALICAMASFAAVGLLQHVQRSSKKMRKVWLAISAVATGFGIWATHFIAMLAFQPDIATGYDIGWTVFSLVSAIALTGVGLAVSVSPTRAANKWIGGAIVGGGIAVMHYAGMTAFEIPGRIEWDIPFVLLSIALGLIFGALALPIALRRNTTKQKVLGAIVLTIAICSHHFTGMAAAGIVVDPSIKVSATALPAGWLAVGVALVTVVITFLASVGLLLDRRDIRRNDEAARMQGLADSAVEGLVICDAETQRVITANRSFCALANLQNAPLGRAITEFFPHAIQQIPLTSDTPFETTLHAADGSEIPVEIIRHGISYVGEPQEVFAVRDIRQRKDAEAEIHFLAHHDTLTKLANRRNFEKTLEKEVSAHQHDRCLAVLFLDLDRFKEINDLYGHFIGDAVLRYVAEVVTGVLKPGQMVARLGGDEFAVVLPGLTSRVDAGVVARSILQALGEPNSQLPAEALIGTSIGIACFPQDAEDRVALLSHADAALYEAKLAGRGTYRFFESSMGEKLKSRRQFEQDIRLAISRNEFSLAFQPQADLKSDRIIGFEALLRWHHKTEGSIAPDVFIPIAEECGAILKIGEWVLRAACREAASWKADLGISVNVSAVQLHSGNLNDIVRDVLKETKLAPGRLELEITETALIKDIGRALSTLNRLKKQGVRIAMDDFGTGYSSLANLRSFPFDKIKVDRSLIKCVDKNDEAAAIMRAVVGLARGLRMPVLAEGVETDGELNFLRAEACDAFQGYLLGRPRPIEAFARHTNGTASVSGNVKAMPRADAA